MTGPCDSNEVCHGTIIYMYILAVANIFILQLMFKLCVPSGSAPHPKCKNSAYTPSYILMLINIEMYRAPKCRIIFIDAAGLH
jgi:hypothetical protein